MSSFRTPLDAPNKSFESCARVLLLFIDGIGLGPGGTDNPFRRGAMPFLESRLGKTLTREVREQGTSADEIYIRGIDAALGVDGLPQSATGQTALFTGVNAPAVMGRHVTAFPGKILREILVRDSVFRRVVEDGGRATFANAFSPRYYELLAQRRVKKSASVFATEAASLPLRGLDDLRSGRAVSWDIKGDLLVTGLAETTDLSGLIYSSAQAGAHLAAVVERHDLTLYETFLPDLAGHRRLELAPHEILARIDGLLSGLIQRLEAEADRFTVVVTSDHGNFEDLSHRRHTKNPVPLLVFGNDIQRFVSVECLTDLAPILFDLSRRAR